MDIYTGSKGLLFAAQEADSYMAGQRAALMEAFQLMLPGQQQLGSMASNLQRLQSQVLASSCLSRGPTAGLQFGCKPCSWLVLVPVVMDLSRTVKPH